MNCSVTTGRLVEYELPTCRLQLSHAKQYPFQNGIKDLVQERCNIYSVRQIISLVSQACKGFLCVAQGT